VLTTGGSLANLIATVTARRERLPPDFLKGTLYTSEQAHHSVARAAVLAGFPLENVRQIACDEHFRVRPGALEEAVIADRASGMAPFLVVGHAGTTNTGAVDDLAELSRVARQHNLWFHVDAAYGGFFALTARGKVALRGIEEADSVTLDPHKSLFLPYGTGCLLVRDRDSLARAHRMHASYLPPMQTDPDLVDFCDLSPELSRDARGLRVWLPLKMHGAGAFRRSLDEKLDLACFAAEALRSMDHVEIVAEPALSLFAFRVKPSGYAEGERLNTLNRKWLSAVNEKQRVLLTGTMLDGRFVLRMCVLSFRTHRDRIEMGLCDLRESLRDVLARG